MEMQSLDSARSRRREMKLGFWLRACQCLETDLNRRSGLTGILDRMSINKSSGISTRIAIRDDYEYPKIPNEYHLCSHSLLFSRDNLLQIPRLAKINKPF